MIYKGLCTKVQIEHDESIKYRVISGTKLIGTILSYIEHLFQILMQILPGFSFKMFYYISKLAI